MLIMSGAQGFSFWEVISEARQIIRAHSRHFFALSLLFLFPLSFSSVIYLALYAALDGWASQPPPILLTLLFTLFSLCFTPCALGTITYSTFNGFYARPLTLASSIKSLLHSFLPLLSTLIVCQTIVVLIGLVFGVLAALGLLTLGVVEVKNYGESISFWVLVIVLVVVLVSIILWVQVKWSLAYVIVVEESKWGYEALRRSGELVKESGMKGVALCISLYFGIVSLCMNYLLLVTLGSGSAASIGHWSWSVVFEAVGYSLLTAQLMLYALAANVVLYIYCKSKAPFGIAEQDFGSNYVCLPFHKDAKLVSAEEEVV